MKKKITLIFVCILILAISNQVWAFSGASHTRTWVYTTGLIGNTDVAKENLRNLWKKAQFFIDSYKDEVGNNIYQDLVDEFDWFDWGEARHRILFHWVFNNSPMDHEPFGRQLGSGHFREYYNDPDAGIKAEWDFFDRIEALHEERKEALIYEVKKVTGFDRYASTALASIIYDIHMLCDYSGKIKTVNYLPKINFLRDDIINNGFHVLLLDAHPSPDDLLGQIEEEFKFPYDYDYDIKDKDIMNNHAKHIIQITGKYLPQILGGNYYKNTLEEQGLGVNFSNFEQLTDFLDREFERLADKDEDEYEDEQDYESEDE